MNYEPVAIAIYELGRKARREGKSIDCNPYGGALNHRSWNVGWRSEDERIAGKDGYAQYLEQGLPLNI